MANRGEKRKLPCVKTLDQEKSNNTIFNFTDNTPPTKSPILLITTHGEVSLSKKQCPINVTKINAAPFGCSNYLSASQSFEVATNIINLINTTENDPDFEANIIDIMKNITLTNQTHLLDKEKTTPLTSDEKRFTNSPLNDKIAHNNIQTWKPDHKYYDKVFFLMHIDEDHISQKTPYHDSIFFFMDGHAEDVLENIVEKNIVEKNIVEGKYKVQNTIAGYNIMLSEILKYLSDAHKIESLIIIDLTCSEIPVDERNLRSILRNLNNEKKKVSYGGKLQRKTKKLNNKKIRINKRKTKKIKTKKIKKKPLNKKKKYIL